ncbi:EF-hand domain-containing protein [Actinokineospora sp. HUAS TT18]|uniref:EF-hand domain-containing protein n=1 Tax=Actinokineospora sp. HUAS TT18 TaxID=3447451 RepID=UPI003F5278B9
MAKKLARRFQVWDYDGNGVIEQVDFVRRGRRLAVGLGFSVGSPEHQVIHETFVQQWDALAGAADTDADGKITEPEYVAAFTSLIVEHPEAFDELYAPLIRLTMQLADADGDGGLDRAEWLNWATGYLGQSADEAGASFELLDHNGDGKVSTEEAQKGIREFYLGTDPNADANLLLGPLD